MDALATIPEVRVVGLHGRGRGPRGRGGCALRRRRRLCGRGTDAEGAEAGRRLRLRAAARARGRRDGHHQARHPVLRREADRERPARRPGSILKALERRKLVTSVGYMMRYRDSARRGEGATWRATSRSSRAAPGSAACRGCPGGGARTRAAAKPWSRRRTSSTWRAYLFGEVDVRLLRGPPGPDHGRRGLLRVEDASICTLTFESGLLCEITSSCAVQKSEISLEVFGMGGRLKLNRWPFELTLQTRRSTSLPGHIRRVHGGRPGLRQGRAQRGRFGHQEQLRGRLQDDGRHMRRREVHVRRQAVRV